MPAEVTVLLPIHRASPGLGEAIADIRRQRHSDGETLDLDIILLVNGPDPEAHRVAAAHAKQDHRIRICRLDTPGLARALNAGLALARTPLVARMDDDDRCPPDRFATQIEAIGASPSLVALGCAWEVRTPGGRVREVVYPPTDPLALRWRLLEENCLTHGSMVMRREAVLARGGYDESLERAQDYDLWLRLSRDGLVGAVARTLYTYCLRDEREPLASSESQAHAAAGLMLREWALTLGLDLPNGDGGDRVAHRDLLDAIAGVLLREPGAVGRVERATRGAQPSGLGLLARQWAASRPDRVTLDRRERAECALLQQALRAIESSGHGRVWLWGAGARGQWALDRAGSGIEIAGFLDDAGAGQTLNGLDVLAPGALLADGGARRGDAVLITTETHEAALWERGGELRRAGISVFRLFDGHEGVTSATASPAPAGDGARAPRRAG